MRAKQRESRELALAALFLGLRDGYGGLETVDRAQKVLNSHAVVSWPLIIIELLMASDCRFMRYPTCEYCGGNKIHLVLLCNLDPTFIISLDCNEKQIWKRKQRIAVIA